MQNPSLSQMIKNELHISHSQIFTYLQCSLKYYFHYVRQKPQERVSIALPFGSAIHSAIEMYYRSLKNRGIPEPLDAVIGRFEDCLGINLDRIGVPVVFKRNLPDKAGSLAMGKTMLNVFYENIDLKGYQVVDVELPLSARLYTDEGVPTDLKLVGIIDVLLIDDNQELVVVDYKTSVRAKSQTDIYDDLQLSSYSYVISANKFTLPTAPVRCRMDVLRKLKTPKLEIYNTVRTAQDRKRFAKIANAVNEAISAKVFIPIRSYLCSDCPYSKACKAW